MNLFGIQKQTPEICLEAVSSLEVQTDSLALARETEFEDSNRLAHEVTFAKSLTA